MPEKDQSDLEGLKNRYKELETKYDIPTFHALNQEFSIEKIADIETELLTKEIRRFIADKIFNYLRFVETLLNPANAPLFIFSIIKSVTAEDKKKLNGAYEKLSGIDLELIKLDLDSNEKRDAEFIRHSFESWNEIKRELIPIVSKLKFVKEDLSAEKPGNKYFG
jgi:hypothetical protein